MKSIVQLRAGNGDTPTDFQACFSSRAHLKPALNTFYSPARPNYARTRCYGQASPSLWPKTKFYSLEITEPLSPRVTCAGRIKIRSKKKFVKSRQSVVENDGFVPVIPPPNALLLMRSAPARSLITKEKAKKQHRLSDLIQSMKIRERKLHIVEMLCS